jgi:hypothetical protein
MTSLEQTTNVEKYYTCAHAKTPEWTEDLTPRRKDAKVGRYELPQTYCILAVVLQTSTELDTASSLFR